MNNSANITMEAAPGDVIEYIIQADPLNFTAIRCTCRRFSALQLKASLSWFVNEYMYLRNTWMLCVEGRIAPKRKSFTVLLDDGRPIYIFKKSDVANGTLASFLNATVSATNN